MTKVSLFLLVILAGLPLHSIAQYKGPAVEACRAYALKDLQRGGASANAVVLESDSTLNIARYSGKVGTQPVSSILTGNGAVVYDGAPSAELSFICLLADEKRPVFFSWQARPNAPVLPQCERSASLRGKQSGCFELLLQTAEQDLSQVYAYRFQEANARGEKSLAAYRKANDEWREYREAECARRHETAAAGASAEAVHAACMIELTRRRALDMK
jgi:uncharacterized protein YecT (DUF1311 family)